MNIVSHLIPLYMMNQNSSYIHFINMFVSYYPAPSNEAADHYQVDFNDQAAMANLI